MTQGKYENLQQATNEFLNSLQQGNANLRAQNNAQRINVDGRQGILLTLDNVNEATNQKETVNIVTTQLRTGQMFYLIAVCPTSEYNGYQSIFENIVRSLKLQD